MNNQDLVRPGLLLPLALALLRTEADYYAAPRPEDVADQVAEQLRAAKLL